MAILGFVALLVATVFLAKSGELATALFAMPFLWSGILVFSAFFKILLPVSPMSEAELIKARGKRGIQSRLNRLREQLTNLKSQPRVRCAPGCKLLAFAEFFFSPRTFTLVLAPVISDLQEEYFQALSQKRSAKAEWVRFRGYYSFWKTVGVQACVSHVRVILKIWKSIP